MATIATAIAVYLLAAGSSAALDVVNEQVDLIEVNHCHDAQGQLVFDQLLFYDWCPLKSRYEVRDWCLLKSPQQLPRRNHERGGYVTAWREGPLLRKVHAEAVRESWTPYDPEILEQQSLPRDQRRSFTRAAAQRRASSPPPAGSEQPASSEQPAEQRAAASVLRR